MSAKQCSVCGKLLPLASFYRNRTKRDGYNPWCKACQEDYMRAYREANRERRSAYMREWLKTPKGRAHQRRAKESLRRRRPEVIKARNDLNHAIERGDLVRQPCQFCGEPNAEAHHPDHTKPLDVIWACFRCHREQLHGQQVVSNWKEG